MRTINTTIELDISAEIDPGDPQLGLPRQIESVEVRDNDGVKVEVNGVLLELIYDKIRETIKSEGY